jgi:phage host-nuclease inhibitor protein Gam
MANEFKVKNGIKFPDNTIQTTAANGIRVLNNPNAYSTSANDNFAKAVAISGNYVIVGALGEDDAGGTDSGKAYIFNVTTGELVSTLNNPNAYSTSAYDGFGYAVAISGNYAIVSAYAEDDAGGTDSGKAYIFNVTTGALVWTLNNPNPYSTSANDFFGNAVAISGNYAIVGAFAEDDANGSNSGKAYIFNVTTGDLVWTLNNPNAYSTSSNDIFSYLAVSISGNYAIVGAYGEDDAGGFSSGKAYIFNVTTGALVWTLNNPNAYSTSSADNFGYAVSISGNYAIVGAPQEDDASGGDTGKAYIFNVTTGQLVWTLNNPNAYLNNGSDNFGNAVSISGNYAIVGAYLEGDTQGTGSGKAYIFNVTTGQLVLTLNNPNAYSTGVNDNFGYAVAISGNYAIVGAYLEDDSGGISSGTAYIFNLSAQTLEKLADVTTSSLSQNDLLTYNGTAWTNTNSISVANGGTGATTLTANNVILGNGTSAVQFVAPGTSGNVLTSNGTTWVSQAPSGGGGGGSGTVTSVATGTGLTGGPITTTGTISLTGQALAVHNLATSGFFVRTGADTVVARTISAGPGISVSDGDGVSNNPTIGLTGQAQAIHNLSSNGILVRTANSIFGITSRTITASTGITISDGDGVAANPTVALTGQALAVHNLGTNGIVARTGSGTVAARTITAGPGIAITNGNGVSGNPTITARSSVSSTTSSSSVTPDVSQFDMYAFTALAATLTINAPTGSPQDGQRLSFRILDNGTSRTLQWNGTYTAIGVLLPTTTVINKTTYIGCIYNAAATRWDVIAVATQS